MGTFFHEMIVGILAMSASVLSVAVIGYGILFFTAFVANVFPVMLAASPFSALEFVPAIWSIVVGAHIVIMTSPTVLDCLLWAVILDIIEDEI